MGLGILFGDQVDRLFYGLASAGALLCPGCVRDSSYYLYRVPNSSERVGETHGCILTHCDLIYLYVRQGAVELWTRGWINDRIHLYILLMLAAWLISDMGKAFRYTIAGCLILFSLLHFGRTAYDHARIAPEIAELVSGTHLIEPHTTYQIRAEEEGWHKSEALGKVKYVTPYVHHMALYGVYADDVAHLANYEAAFNYFPINRERGKRAR